MISITPEAVCHRLAGDRPASALERKTRQPRYRLLPTDVCTHRGLSFEERCPELAGDPNRKPNGMGNLTMSSQKSLLRE